MFVLYNRCNSSNYYSNVTSVPLFNESLRLCWTFVDHNDDGIITKEEFIALPRGEVDDMMHGEESDAIWTKERRKEFEDVIDLDHDGKVGIEELKVIFLDIVYRQRRRSNHW